MLSKVESEVYLHGQLRYRFSVMAFKVTIILLSKVELAYNYCKN